MSDPQHSQYSQQPPQRYSSQPSQYPSQQTSGRYPYQSGYASGGYAANPVAGYAPPAGQSYPAGGYAPVGQSYPSYPGGGRLAPRGAVHYPEVNLRTARKTFSRMGWTLLVWMLGTELAAILLRFVGNILVQEIDPAARTLDKFPWLSLMLSNIAQYAVALPLCLIVVFTIPKYPPQPRRPDPGARFGARDWLTILVMGFPVMFVGSILGSSLSNLLSDGKFDNLLNSVTSGTTPLDHVVEGITFVVFAPLAEEFIFRRCLIDRMRVYGEKLAVFSSALLFGLMHANLYQFFYAFGWGLLWGYVYVRTGKLRYTIALHATVNFIGGVVAPAVTDVDDKAMSDLMSGDVQRITAAFGRSGPQLIGYMLYTTLILVLVIVGVVLLVNVIRRRRAYFQQSPKELVPRNRVRVALANPGIIVFGILTVLTTFVTPLMMRFS
ncbi:type II CAAX prenyl endopeptidase Rce1 family protein [Bifidobacterium callimiconis]|uniref:CAAX amino terminal protease n=1 Tax=Bifidobacterium callimiconis TaxID=2306973 RepID=A0A430FBG6_9BIFI|nr:CPBP family glutamic-type intramembrane protease [Bifidobacterium callimiconis]RSX50173.1 CAAX amino terminal protease [Bifidobacterium callimiconis]